MATLTHRSRSSTSHGLVPAALGVNWLTSGANYIAFKLATVAIPPLVLAGLRSIISALLLLPFALLLARRNAHRPSGRELSAAAISGAILLILAQGTMIWGVRLLPAGVAAVLASSSPLFVALFGWALFRERLSPRQLIGVFAGFAGVGLLAATEARSGGFNVLGAAAMLMGAMAWAVGSLYERRTQLPDSTIVLLATQMLTAGVLLIPVTLVTGELAAWHATRVGPSAWTALAYLVVGGSLVAIGLFTWLNRTISSVVANSFNYVSPLVAMGLAAMLLGERLTVMKLASAGIALFGVALMVTTPKTKVAP